MYPGKQPSLQLLDKSQNWNSYYIKLSSRTGVFKSIFKNSKYMTYLGSRVLYNFFQSRTIKNSSNTLLQYKDSIKFLTDYNKICMGIRHNSGQCASALFICSQNLL